MSYSSYSYRTHTQVIASSCSSSTLGVGAHLCESSTTCVLVKHTCHCLLLPHMHIQQEQAGQVGRQFGYDKPVRQVRQERKKEANRLRQSREPTY